MWEVRSGRPPLGGRRPCPHTCRACLRGVPDVSSENQKLEAGPVPVTGGLGSLSRNPHASSDRLGRGVNLLDLPTLGHHFQGIDPYLSDPFYPIPEGLGTTNAWLRKYGCHHPDKFGIGKRTRPARIRTAPLEDEPVTDKNRPRFGTCVFV